MGEVIVVLLGLLAVLMAWIFLLKEPEYAEAKTKYEETLEKQQAKKKIRLIK